MMITLSNEEIQNIILEHILENYNDILEAKNKEDINCPAMNELPKEFRFSNINF